MNNTFFSKNLGNLKPQSFEWNSVQTEMRNKLGIDVYESWLKNQFC